MPGAPPAASLPAMRHYPIVFALAALFAACVAKEEAGTESLRLMEKMVTTLEGVKDEASAKAAATALDPIVTRMKELQKTMEAMPEAQRSELEAKHKQEGEALAQRMMKEMMRIGSDQKLSAILMPVMEKMGR